MTLLDEVREFASRFERGGECPVCGAYDPEDGPPENHADDCEMLTLMPRLVAALEAAERMLLLVDGDEPMDRDEAGRGDSSWSICGGDYGTLGNHAPDCPWEALREAHGA